MNHALGILFGVAVLLVLACMWPILALLGAVLWAVVQQF